MKVRSLVAFLEQHGCVPKRTCGSHRMYELPNGTVVPVVVNHLNAEVGRDVLASVRRALRHARMKVP